MFVSVYANAIHDFLSILIYPGLVEELVDIIDNVDQKLVVSHKISCSLFPWFLLSVVNVFNQFIVLPQYLLLYSKLDEAIAASPHDISVFVNIGQ